MENITQSENEKLQGKVLKRDLLFKNLKVGLAFVAIIFVCIFWAQRLGAFTQANNNTIAVINFNKEITSAYISETMSKMDELAYDKNIKEILFIMNSPGGSPAASEEMSAYLKHFIERKPVTMYVETVAASGGYYIASAIKPLLSNKNAIVGSIGVIMPRYSIQKLAEAIGVKEDFIAAGKFKKPMSIFKDVDEESKEYIQSSLLRPTYKNFINAVAENRDLPAETIEKFAEGKVFIANKPEIQGILIDKITTLTQVRRDLVSKYGEKTLFLNTDEQNGVLDMLKSSIDVTISLPNQTFKMN